MNFQAKLILITLGILIATLMLNSVLSLASFEKIYVTSLVSTYEIAGKNLKRKVERSLRFGKPLDKFKGMDLLIKEMMDKNPSISYISIADPAGLILYHSNKMKIGGRLKYDIPEFTMKKQVDTRLVDGEYVTFLPLNNRKKEIAGVIHLSFSRKVIYAKLKKMAFENLNILWPLMLLTSVGLIFMLAMLVMRPIRQEVKEISRMLEWPGDVEKTRKRYQLIPDETVPDDPNASPLASIQNSLSSINLNGGARYLDINRIKSELDRLGFHIYQFVSGSLNTLQTLEELGRQHQTVFSSCDALQEQIEKIHQMLKSDRHHECSKADRQAVEQILLHLGYLLETLHLIRHILSCQRQTRKIGI